MPKGIRQSAFSKIERIKNKIVLSGPCIYLVLEGPDTKTGRVTYNDKLIDIHIFTYSYKLNRESGNLKLFAPGSFCLGTYAITLKQFDQVLDMIKIMCLEDPKELRNFTWAI